MITCHKNRRSKPLPVIAVVLLFLFVFICLLGGVCFGTTIVSTQNSTILANAKTTITNSDSAFLFRGNFLFSPHSLTNETCPGPTNLIWQATNGIAVFCGTNFQNASAYGFFGSNMALCTAEATFTLLGGDTQNVILNDAQFPTNGSLHVGITPRLIDRFNFAGLAMVATNCTFQIDDRTNGTEVVTLYQMPQGTITNGGTYTIKVENTNGNSANFYLYDVNRNLLTNVLNYTFTVGVPAIGFQAIHGYATRSYFRSANVWDANGHQLMDGTFPWSEVSSNRCITNTWIDNGVLTHYADSNHTYNIQSWAVNLSPKIVTNITVYGEMMRVGVQSRLGGMALRSSPDAKQGYIFGYDHTNLVLRIWRGPAESPTVVASSGAVTLTANVWYPYVISAQGNSLSFTINGVTVSGTDSTYAGPGFVGVVGLNGNFSYQHFGFSP